MKPVFFLTVFILLPQVCLSLDLVSDCRALVGLLHREPSAQKSSFPKKSIQPYWQTIVQASSLYRLDPLLVQCVIKHESAFDPYAVSSKGAMGLMQLMPDTAREVGVSEPFNARQNIYGGTKYLKNMIRRFDGDLYKALLAYNAGPSRVARGRIPQESYRYARRILKEYRGY